MRKKIVVGNWKMNKTVEEARELAQAIRDSKIGLSLVDIVVCPPFTALHTVAEALEPTVIKIGAQNVFWEKEGAYTGEISPQMIKDFGDYVIIGHSERRKNIKETDEEINKKIKVAGEAGLNIILCIGEDLAQYRKGNWEVVIDQLIADLKLLSPNAAKEISVAYEPIWAIGTGEAATPEYANKMSIRIRQEAGGILGKENSANLRILYGGSVDPTNAAEFVSKSDIDGLLVGGASMDAGKFVNIIKAVNKVKK